MGGYVVQSPDPIRHGPKGQVFWRTEQKCDTWEEAAHLVIGAVLETGIQWRVITSELAMLDEFEQEFWDE